MTCTAIVLVLNGRFDIQAAADTKYPLLVHIQLVVMGQIVPDATVTLVGTFCMDLLHNLSDLLIFQFSVALSATEPAIVGRSGHSQYCTGLFYWISIYFFVFLNCQVDMRLPNLAQRPLLSISSNFFSSRFSISSIFSLCLSCSISIWACSSSVRGR